MCIQDKKYWMDIELIISLDLDLEGALRTF